MELDLLFRECDGTDRAAFAALLLTGLREQELCFLLAGSFVLRWGGLGFRSSRQRQRLIEKFPNLQYLKFRCGVVGRRQSLESLRGAEHRRCVPRHFDQLLADRLVEMQPFQHARHLAAALVAQESAERLVLHSADVELAAGDYAEEGFAVAIEEGRANSSRLSRPSLGSSIVEGTPGSGFRLD